MTTAPDTALRTALRDALRADSGVQALMGALPRIYDYAPESAAFPFITVRVERAAWDTTSDRGAESTVLINCWFEAEGKKDGEAILWAVQTALREAALALSDHRLINLVFQFQDVMREEGRLHVGHQRWRAVTEEL